MSIADALMQASAANLIRRWGSLGYLLRGVVARPVTVAILDYNPRARGLALEGAERAIITADIDTPPDFEQDKLWHGGRLFQIPTPVKGPRPGDTVIYYDADIVFERDLDISPYVPA